jgi:hypothetical protein
MYRVSNAMPAVTTSLRTRPEKKVRIYRRTTAGTNVTMGETRSLHLQIGQAVKAAE